jgi:pimeloyl-ACP methyl ester carboxylesterase
MANRIAALHRDGIRVVTLPHAAHHAMFDQPVALIELLQILLKT